MTDTLKSRILRFSCPEPNSGCWLWTGCIDERKWGAYGRCAYNGRTDYAHRVSYRAFVGPIPTNYQIDHKCKITLCVNPDHLEAVTAAINVQRSASPEATRKRHQTQTHCKNGHPLSGGNIRLTKSGSRLCLTCATEYHRNYRRTHRIQNQKYWREYYHRKRAKADVLLKMANREATP